MTWTVVIAIGVATYALRACFLVGLDSSAAPGVERYLRFVPVAVLPALAASAVVGNGNSALDLRVAAALVGAAVAYKTRSVAAVMATGMIVLWLLQAWSQS